MGEQPRILKSVLWTFDVRGAEVRYAVSLAYSNGKEGENEVLSVAIDGRALSSFQNRDSGDAVEGCVEIDIATLSPAQPS